MSLPVLFQKKRSQKARMNNEAYVSTKIRTSIFCSNIHLSCFCILYEHKHPKTVPRFHVKRDHTEDRSNLMLGQF